jgi:hypothetical protein
MASEHGKQGLHRMATETGGAYCEVTNTKRSKESTRRSRMLFAINMISGIHLGGQSPMESITRSN